MRMKMLQDMKIYKVKLTQSNFLLSVLFIPAYPALPTQFTAEPLATFDLTPASGSDGMVFNLTPAPTSATAPAPAPPPPTAPAVNYDLNTVYNSQLTPNMTAMTFNSAMTPVAAMPSLPSLPPSITPDFTGLLPPPPPSSHVATSRPPPHLLSLSPLNIPSPRSVSPQQSPRQHSVSPRQGAAQPVYKAPPPPYKSPPYYQPPAESSPPAPPPPPYPAQVQAQTQGQNTKLPSYSLEELKDLPGANLKKSTVELNTYISALAQNKHPNFANVDSFAERCLACIVRKIKSNLPTLKALMESSLAWRGDCGDPGCVLIPRMKDGRITISRLGGGPTGAGGTKKIHPHLALVQIFKNPGVVNHNCLVSVSKCAAPFLTRSGDEGEMVCISPMHYNMDNGKSPVTPRKKVSNQIHSANTLLNQMKAQPIESSRVASKAAKVDEKNIAFRSDLAESDSDLLTDSDDDGEDWREKWKERVRCEDRQVEQFPVDNLVRDIRVMSVETDGLEKEELVSAKVDLIERLKIMEDFKNLLNGKYDLEQLKILNKTKPKKVAKPSKPVKLPYTGKKRGPKPKKKLGETWVSQTFSEDNKEKAEPSSNNIETSNEKIDSKPSNPVEEDREEEEVIQNLLEDIKGSFESQFDMDLDTFGGTEGSSDFGMATPFNLSSLDALSKDSFVDQSLLGPGIVGGSSDAMFGGNSLSLNIPDFEQDWQQEKDSNAGKGLSLPLQDEGSLMDELSFVSGPEMTGRSDQSGYFAVQPGASRHQQFSSQFSSDQQTQNQTVFPAQSYLPSGTLSLSQDQFLNMFDED